MFYPIQQKSENAAFLCCCISFLACLPLSTSPYCTHSEASPAATKWMNFRRKFQGGLVNRPILRGIYDTFSLLEAVQCSQCSLRKNEINAFSCLRLLSTSFPVLLLLNLFVFLSIFKKFCFVLSVTSFHFFFSCQHPKSACSPRQ